MHERHRATLHKEVGVLRLFFFRGWGDGGLEGLERGDIKSSFCYLLPSIVNQDLQA